jgi:hypothetical protein
MHRSIHSPQRLRTTISMVVQSLVMLLLPSQLQQNYSWYRASLVTQTDANAHTTVSRSKLVHNSRNLETKITKILSKALHLRASLCLARAAGFKRNLLQPLSARLLNSTTTSQKATIMATNSTSSDPSTSQRLLPKCPNKFDPNRWKPERGLVLPLDYRLMRPQPRSQILRTLIQLNATL